MSDTILVFPSSIEASISFIRDARRWNLRVIGSSSLTEDPYAKQYDAWENLPYIHEDDFLPKLKKLIKNYNISSIYTPHAPTFLRLSELAEELTGVRLVGESPYSTQMNRVALAHQTASHSYEEIVKLTNNSDSLSQNFLAALLAQTTPLYGECLQEKMTAICAVFCEAPVGDVVEIGTFFGKSAFLLNRLSGYFKIGTTVCVDPWNMGLSIQQESPSTIQALSSVWDWETVFQGFLLTMQASYVGDFNYIRAASVDAYSQYKNNSLISSPEFGTTQITHRISVLPLDGNHDEQAVSKDLELWGSHVMPGGWIIFDDYNWSQGDGPRKVADKMLNKNADLIENFFVMGGAAFVKVKDKIRV